jgi:hypothetical protein
VDDVEEVRSQQKRICALAPIPIVFFQHTKIVFFQHTKEVSQIGTRQDLLDSFGNSGPTRRPPVSNRCQERSWYFTAEPTPLLGELIEVTGLGYPHLRKRSRIMVAAESQCGAGRVGSYPIRRDSTICPFGETTLPRAVVSV